MSDSENVGNFHVVSLSGRTATFLTEKGLPDTAKALAWARRNVTPEGGCKYAVVQVTKRINVDFKPRLVESDGLQEIGDEPTEAVPLNHPDGTPKKLLTEADAKADLAGTPRPDNDDHPEAVGAKPKGSYKPAPTPPPAPPVEASADDAPPAEAPKPAPKAVPKPPPARPVSVPLAGPLPAVVAAAAPKAPPTAPKPPPPPRPAVVAPKPPAPVAAPTAGGGGLDDLDLA